MAIAEIRDGEIFVKTNWTEKDLASQVPGMNARSARPDREGGWYGRLSWGTIVTLHGVFKDKLEIGPQLQEWMNWCWSWITPALQHREATEVTGDWTEGTVFDQLYSYQKIGSNFLGMIPDGVLICDEMGTGKTPTALTALGRIPNALPAIVICPNSVKHQWADEAAIWLPQATPYVIAGGMQTRRKLLADAAANPHALVVINFEAVRSHSRLAPYGSVRLVRCKSCGGPDDTVTPQKCHKHPKELNAMTFHTVIVDEAHRMKDPTSQQTRACWAVQHSHTVTRRWALTGTPLATDIGDLWSIMHGVAPLDFPTKTEFIQRFALLGWSRHASLDIVGIRPDTRPEFDQIVQPRMRRVLKDIVLPQLPQKVRTHREAPMVAKQAKIYEQMKEEMFAELEGGDVIFSPSNLTKATRLLQFSSSYAKVEIVGENEDGSPKYKVELIEPSPKIDVLLEIIEEMGDRQLAVCAMSRQLIELTAARFDSLKKPITYRLLTGAIPQTIRPQNIRDFQDGHAQVMLFTVGAGGVGVNMTAADTIVFLQRSWSMLENKQAEDRVHRVGSERHESIGVIDIIAPGTIEVDQRRRLWEKEMRLEELVEDRKRRLAAGLDASHVDELMNEVLNGPLS